MYFHIFSVATFSVSGLGVPCTLVIAAMKAVLERLLFANSLRTTANHVVPMGLAHCLSLNLPCCSPTDR